MQRSQVALLIMFIVALSTLLQLIIAPLWGLSEVEALVGLYSERPDIAHVYYPALPGFIQATFLPITQFISSQELAFRIPSIIMGFFTNILLIFTCRKLFKFDSWLLPLWVIVFFNVMTITHVNSLFDIVLSTMNFLTLALVLTLFLALQHNLWWQWLLASLITILFINTHYIALPIWLFSSVYLLLEIKSNWKKYLWVYFYLLSGLLAVAPIIIFNNSNSNIIILHLLELISDQYNSIKLFGTFLTIQLSLTSIIGLVSILIGVFSLLSHSQDVNIRFLVINSFIILLITYITNFFGLFNILIFTGNIIILPIAIRWIILSRKQWLFYLKWIFFGYGFVITIIFYMSAFEIISYPTLRNPFASLSGWKEAAFLAKHFISQDEGNDNVIFIEDTENAARISWYARPFNTIILENDTTSDFSLWEEENNDNKSGFLIIPDTYEQNTHLEANRYFENCEIYTSMNKEDYRGSLINRIHIQKCISLKQ